MYVLVFTRTFENIVLATTNSCSVDVRTCSYTYIYIGSTQGKSVLQAQILLSVLVCIHGRLFLYLFKNLGFTGQILFIG